MLNHLLFHLIKYIIIHLLITCILDPSVSLLVGSRAIKATAVPIGIIIQAATAIPSKA
jgi:hypothetical protein